jgi:hypothetical protein
LAVPAAVVLSVALTFAQTRYRAPAEIALVLLDAVAIDAAWRAWRRWRTRPSTDVVPDADPDDDLTAVGAPV